MDSSKAWGACEAASVILFMAFPILHRFIDYTFIIL